jgi:hypothetical protein
VCLSVRNPGQKQALAAASLGEQDGEAVQLDGEAQAAQGLVEAAVAIKPLFGDGAIEGMARKTVMAQQLAHGQFSWGGCFQWASTRVRSACR